MKRYVFIFLILLISCSVKDECEKKFNEFGENQCKKMYKNECYFKYDSSVKTYNDFYQKICLITIDYKNKLIWLKGRKPIVKRYFELEDSYKNLKYIIPDFCNKTDSNDKNVKLLYLYKKKKYLKTNDYDAVILLENKTLKTIGIMRNP